jgi:hypothetical protein
MELNQQVQLNDVFYEEPCDEDEFLNDSLIQTRTDLLMKVDKEKRAFKKFLNKPNDTE